MRMKVRRTLEERMEEFTIKLCHRRVGGLHRVLADPGAYDTSYVPQALPVFLEDYRVLAPVH